MRKIIHIDMDCFFAAVEMRDDPSLRDIPIAIGGEAGIDVVSSARLITRARRFAYSSKMPTAMVHLNCVHNLE